MELSGYAGKVARIDLTTGKMRYEPISEDDALKYIGGRGLGVKYVFDNGPTVEPFSPDNLLCFMLGPLTGTETNMSGRMAVVTKSPLTGTVTDSHQGGYSAARLKWAGFDGLLFKGASENPVYALVENGEVELRDARDLWGRGVHATVKTLLARHGPDDVSVVAIGQAGENLVRFAALLNENDRASGRGGTGAVAGSKRLKAIVIKATKKGMPKPPDRAVFKQAHKDALAAISSDAAITKPKKGALSVLGTNVLMNTANAVGGLPTRNAQTTVFPMAGNIGGERVKQTILVNNPTCHACPVACKKEVETEPGKYHVRMESVEYESAWAFGAACFNGNRDAIAYMIDLCNDYGMDTIECGSLLAMTMEASEKGLIKEAVPWGDVDKMIDLIHKAATRVGIGDTLAEGPARAAAVFGDPDMSITVKGQAIPAYDPRAFKGMGVSYATSNRGGCHLRGYSIPSELMGIPYPTNLLDWEGKGKLIKLMQEIHAVSDSFDICKFSSFCQNLDHYAAQYSAIVGVPMDAEGIRITGERIYNLERYYNNKAGIGEGADTLPKRFLTEPSPAGVSKGQVCELDLMLKEYYEARGWKNGVVPQSKLKELGII